MSIYNASKYFIVTFKRFKKTSDYMGEFDKIKDKISFPLKDFNLTDFVQSSNQPGQSIKKQKAIVYDLYGVINHFDYGGNIDRGHYTAYIKNREDGYWYEMDDSRVGLIAEKDVCSEASYVLFYERQETK